LTGTRRCAACGADNGLAARFCRRCGASLPTEGTDAGSGTPPAFAAFAEPPAFDGARVFVELCWLCGSLIFISVALAVWIRISHQLTEPELIGVAATALVAQVSLIMNWSFVLSAFRLPTLGGLRDTALVALLTAPILELGFWLLGRMGFPLYSGYLTSYVREGWPLWVGFVAIAIVTPISEELLFRGLIQPKLEQLVSSNEALVVQAAIFSALHLSPVILLTHFVMGLAFGWIRRKTGSLYPSMLLHGAWNAWCLCSAPAVTSAR
jgi:membrane protease YdiL (CAAX protease family)